MYVGGGCTVPHPFADAPPSPVGVDCTAIEGADAVDCLNSRCFVKTCREGYQVGEAENTCIALLVSDSARVRTVAAMHVDRSLQDSLTPSSSTPSSHGDDYYRNADYRRHSLDTSLDNLSVVSSTAAVADSDCRDDLVDIPATLTSSTDLHTRQIEDNDVVYVGSGISDGTDNHGSRSPIRTDYVMERDTDLGFAWRGHDDDLVSYTGIALDTVGTSTTSVTDIRTHRARGRVNGGSTFHGIEGQGVATSDSSDSTRVGPLLDRRQLDGDVLSFTGVSLGPEGQTSRKKGGELLGSTLTDVWYRVRDSRPYLR
ncbi:hypothetical protein JAAARDRAFT_414275 [Jaapia argillacea MUCL 33604]|uniref:Protein CPL1-like domain-containing protein n=1 Tax=Jaapia argillacea MUCL 33604 TaxID=933084 RepID=A0A067PGA3_9AGAM|nr:hypothetical protein JAAARDRAFT_414275 [Jaapia argillacea MUCL 33604]